MTLSKLSLRNARRQARDYLVYFVTIVMSAALVYAVNGLVFSEEIKALSGAMDSLAISIALSSVVVVCIIGWLVHYTIGFMLTRRSRELGTYLLIGLEPQQVARLFFLENLTVGGIALFFGTLLGNLLFQALRAVTLALFHVPYTFRFTFSIKTVGLTVFYFSLVYLLALLRGSRRIRTMKICDLISYDRKNQDSVIQKSSRRRRIFAASIVFGVIGTLLLLLRNFALGIVGAGFLILFFYGFFISFSSGVPAYFEKHVQQKYQGQTLLVFRALSSKLATMGVVMATVALLFTATLMTEGTGLLFHAMFQSRAEQTTCFDLFISSFEQDEANFDDYRTYIGANIPVRDMRQYAIYEGENLQVTEYIKENANYWGYFTYDTLMKASDYTALREMLGFSQAKLASGQYLIHAMPYLNGVLEDYSEPITVGGTRLTAGGVFTENFTQSMWDGNGRGFILVVPDEVVDAHPISHRIYAAMTAEPVAMSHYIALNDIRNEKFDDWSMDFDTIYTKVSVAEDNAELYAMVVFPLFYLALVLTMVSATILTIEQLSEAGRYRRQFELLDRLGMEQGEMRRVLWRQFAIYYTMPALPPLLISIPFLFAIGNEFDPGVLYGMGQISMIVCAALGLFFSIYLLYIFIAYTSLKRNVLPTYPQ